MRYPVSPSSQLHAPEQLGLLGCELLLGERSGISQLAEPLQLVEGVA